MQITNKARHPNKRDSKLVYKNYTKGTQSYMKGATKSLDLSTPCFARTSAKLLAERPMCRRGC